MLVNLCKRGTCLEQLEHDMVQVCRHELDGDRRVLLDCVRRLDEHLRRAHVVPIAQKLRILKRVAHNRHDIALRVERAHVPRAVGQRRAEEQHWNPTFCRNA